MSLCHSHDTFIYNWCMIQKLSIPTVSVYHTIQYFYTLSVYSICRILSIPIVDVWHKIQYSYIPYINSICLYLPSVVNIQYSAPIYRLSTVFVYTYRRWLTCNIVLLYTVYQQYLVYTYRRWLTWHIVLLYTVYQQYLFIPTIGG